MKRRDLVDLVLLAAIWGTSFLFMRVAAPAFGPVALVEVRMATGGLFLLPLLALRGGLPALRIHGSRIALIGLLNSAAPFLLITYAMLVLTTAMGSVLNATVPLWTALVAALWLNEQPRPMQWLGMAIGGVGVLVLVGDRLDFDPAGSGWSETVAIGAALLGMSFYGLSANLARRTLTGVPTLATATGSQLAAAAMLAPAAVFTWPAQPPSTGAWAAAVVLGLVCTGFAYVLYFRLIDRVGAVRAAYVTYLIPLFATFWGAVFLGEAVTLRLIVGGAVVLAGTALALGIAPRLPLLRRT